MSTLLPARGECMRGQWPSFRCRALTCARRSGVAPCAVTFRDRVTCLVAAAHARRCPDPEAAIRKTGTSLSGRSKAGYSRSLAEASSQNPAAGSPNSEVADTAAGHRKLLELRNAPALA